MAARAENVIVVCRCRPFSEKEKAGGHSKICEIDSNNGVISLRNPKQESDIKTFTFDTVFDEGCTQTEVYLETAQVIVDAALSGFNGTVLVYGQTGTGKTFSMQGVPNVPELRGIIPKTFHHIFDHIAQTSQKKFLVRVSFLEIYNEEIKDLLIKANKNPKGGLDLKEHPEAGVYIKDLSAFVVKSVKEMEHLMDVGNKNRSVGATLMNENSSRSHSIFSITIESSEPGPDGQDRYVSGKLNLVDLAGSERQSKTGASGDRLKEATKINLSLSALGNCISALVDGRCSHIPYRDSKLTRLLQDSLGGNAKTLMIATLSPASYNFEETLSTLRYANRAKNIKNKPVVNEDPKDTMLREYQEEIERLRSALEARKQGGGMPRVVTKVIKKQVKKKVQKLIQRKKVESNSLVGGDCGTNLFNGNNDGTGDSKDALDSNKPHCRSSLGQEPILLNGDTECIDDFEDQDTEESENSDCESEDDPQSISQETSNNLAELDPETIAKLQAEVGAEKQALLASKDIVIEERNRIAAELEKRAADLEKERQERESLASKLKAMEEKLLIGGLNIVDKVNEQERELIEAHNKLQEQHRKERELQLQLGQKQEVQLQLEENHASLQEEIDAKTRKLNKLWSKLQEVKTEINDVKDEFRNEREDLLDTMRELFRELSLKLTIIDNFIPAEERTKIENRAIYDDEKDDWILTTMTQRGLENRIKRPVSIPTIKRPICQYSKIMMSMGDPSLRHRGDNIITLQLEFPERTTLQDVAPKQDGREISAIQGMLRCALLEESNDMYVSSYPMSMTSDLLGKDVLSRGDAQHQYQQAAQYPDRRSADMRRVSGKAELAPGIAGIAGIASSSRSGLLGCQGSKSGRVIEENYPSSKADMTKGRYA